MEEGNNIQDFAADCYDVSFFIARSVMLVMDAIERLDKINKINCHG